MEITGMSPNALNLVLLIYGIAIATGRKCIVNGIGKQQKGSSLPHQYQKQGFKRCLIGQLSSDKVAIITLFVMGALSFATVPASQ